MAGRQNTAVAHDYVEDEVRVPLRVVEPSEGGPRNPPAAPPVSNARIAIAMFLVAESMFFAGLVGAYLVFRVGSVAWPPPGLPALPLGMTWFNTILLFASGATMVAALRAIRRDDQVRLRRFLWWSVALGGVFVGVQGLEWVRLVHHGLTLSSGPYGGTFYTLIGTHAAHVAGAMLWILFVLGAAARGRYSRGQHDGVEICVVYWLYVCALWGLLFGLVYH